MGYIKLIPNGPKNLAAIFPTLNFGNVKSYKIEILDANGNVLGTTPTNLLTCCCQDDKVRLHFLNYLGTFDAVNFLKPKVSHETTSKEFEKGLPNVLAKTATGFERFDIRPNDTYETRTSCYGEQDMLWIQELADSPKVFIERTGKQGQPDYLLPVIITSKKFDKIKNINDFRYDFVIEFKLSNEFMTIRN